MESFPRHALKEFSGKEESGKILEKDLWVRAHSKEITVGKDCLRDIAPVELNGLNKITISK